MTFQNLDNVHKGLRPTIWAADPPVRALSPRSRCSAAALHCVLAPLRCRASLRPLNAA